ncbi:MAG: type II toxin-antitoxin system HipA family toxin [Usitatibacter sp.]
MSRRPTRVKRLALETTQGRAATLLRESQFVVRYSDIALTRGELALSLTMPPRPEGYSANVIPPVLAMNLPEGFLLDIVASRFRKAMDVNDDMNLLALTSTPSSGRVWARLDDDEGDTAQEAPRPSKPMRLREILASPGTEALFDQLVERYALNTAISGVQPKVVVPEARARGRSPVAEKASIHAPDLIVKAGGEFPGIAENEYLCMTMARAAGLEVPDCWLSEDGTLFVIRRFDLGPEGGYLGFEDMASLTGRHPRDKYQAAYADVARAIADFCAPRHRADSLERFFRQLVFCCLIRNGDAHLKNWGVVYSDPVGADDDARLSPVYDLICTPIWIPADTLALGLEGTKAWPTRQTLERFGKLHCEVGSPRRIIDEVVARSLEFRPESKTGMWRAIRAEIERAAATLR